MAKTDLRAALRGEPGPSLVRVVTGLGLATFGLLLVAVIGFYSVRGDSTDVASGDGPALSTDGTTADGQPQTSIDPLTGQPAAGGPTAGATPGAGGPGAST